MLPLEVLRNALRSQVPGWHNASPDRIALKTLAGGMSNVIYLAVLDAADANPRQVVARVLSSALDAVINRDRELQIVRYLSTAGIGPRLFGTCTLPREEGEPGSPGGEEANRQSRDPVMVRMEEYLDGRTLGIRDLRENLTIARQMASKVAALHSQSAGLARQMTQAQEAAMPSPDLAGSLQRFVLIVEALRGHASWPQLRPDLQTLVTGCDWSAEAAWLLRRMVERGGPCVLVHGDLQEGNWIEAAAGGELFLLDYEYSRFDYRGFDAGNLICEHTFDYSIATAPGYSFSSAGYASLVWQREFFGAYAAASARGDAPEGTAAVSSSQPWQQQHREAGSSDPPRSRTTSAAAAIALDFAPASAPLVREARIGILASHLFWALWSVVMGAGKAGLRVSVGAGGARVERSGDDAGSVTSGHSVFDYLHYGRVRLAEYARLRVEFEEECAHVGGASR